MSSTSILPPELVSSSPVSLTVKWGKVDASTAYEIQMRRVGASEEWVTLSDKLTGNIMKKNNLSPATSYIFRFRGLQKNTDWSPASKTMKTEAGVSSVVSNMLGKTLLTAKGKTVPMDCVGNGLFALYFSASWCPPCRQFTPLLKQFYVDVKNAKKKFEIIFVSADHDAGSFLQYFQQHHAWLALPYEAPSRTHVSAYFQVSGIPRLIVFGPNGQIVCNNAVQSLPLTLSTFDGWQKTAGL